MHAKRRGFTLIEVALAVALGIVIMSGSVAVFRQVQQSTKFATAKQMVATIQTNISMEKFRSGKPETLAGFQDNRDTANKPYWPGDGVVGFPADPVMGVTTVTQFDSSLAPVAIKAGAPQNQYDHPIFLTAGMGKGGWLYDPNTGAFRINLSNQDYPDQRPSGW